MVAVVAENDAFLHFFDCLIWGVLIECGVGFRFWVDVVEAGDFIEGSSPVAFL